MKLGNVAKMVKIVPDETNEKKKFKMGRRYSIKVYDRIN
jgi:hypothetical protein